jgi:hypothetical protein
MHPDPFLVTPSIKELLHSPAAVRLRWACLQLLWQATAVVAIALSVTAPRPATAADWPEDTNTIESLTPEQARKLAEEFPGVRVKIDDHTDCPRGLPLNGLKALDAETAQALAKYDKGPVVLNGLTTLDADTAKALAEFEGLMLSLDGLTTLDAETAKALAEFEGLMLSLDGLTTLDAETAKALAEFEGLMLSLGGLTMLDGDTAKALAAFTGKCLLLSGLTTLDAETAKTLAELKSLWLYLLGLTTLDAETAKALAEFKGFLGLPTEVVKAFFAKHPLTPETAPVWAALANGDLRQISALDSPDSIAIAQALATRNGPLALPNLKKISPKTLAALIEKEDVEIPLIESLELIPEPDGSVTEDFVIPESLEKRQQQRRRP